MPPTRQNAAAMALNAGLDLELPATDCYGAPLLQALESGLVSEETLDEAVRRVLRTKFDVGVFDEPYVDVSRAAGAADTSAHRELARTIARKSIVLLKNDGVLPLASRARGDRGDRPERRHGAQPLRRLRLPRACRVAPEGARQRTRRPLDARGGVRGDGRRGDHRARRSSTRFASGSARRSRSLEGATSPENRRPDSPRRSTWRALPTWRSW